MRMTFGMMMRTSALVLALGSLAGAACAAGSVSATAPASVTVLSPISLAKTQDMQFGQVVRPSNANTNTVTLDANDSVTLGGGGNGSLVASTTLSAKFNLQAPAGTTYSTTQQLTFTQTGLTNIAASLPTATAGVLGTVPAAGIQELRYGGQFDMTSATPAQAYTGTLSVTVNYN
jgi:hypothetical protein